MCEWKKKKFKKSHQKLTYVGVEPTTLCFIDHHSTILTTTFPYTLFIFLKINLNHVRSNFLIPLFLQMFIWYTTERCLYLTLVNWVSSLKSFTCYNQANKIEKHTTPKCCEGKKGNPDLCISCLLLYHLSHSTHAKIEKLLTLIRMTKDEKVLAVFKGLLL
jgi:hypothetical protein